MDDKDNYVFILNINMQMNKIMHFKRYFPIRFIL